MSYRNPPLRRQLQIFSQKILWSCGKNDLVVRIWGLGHDNEPVCENGELLHFLKSLSTLSAEHNHLPKIDHERHIHNRPPTRPKNKRGASVELDNGIVN